MADLADRCAAVVRRYGSAVAQWTGDGIMAVFGAPVPARRLLGIADGQRAGGQISAHARLPVSDHHRSRAHRDDAGRP